MVVEAIVWGRWPRDGLFILSMSEKRAKVIALRSIRTLKIEWSPFEQICLDSGLVKQYETNEIR